MTLEDAPVEQSFRQPVDAATRLELRRLLARELEHEALVVEQVRRGSSALPHTRRPWRRRRAATATVLVLFCVWAPMLITMTPLFPPPVIWTLYGASVAIGLVGVLLLPRRGALPFVLFVLLFGIWGALYPVWSAWWPGGRLVVAEVRGLAAIALIGAAFVLLTGPTRDGVALVRRLWLVMVVPLAVFGVGEVVTGWHFSPAGEYGPPWFSPSGPFGNPNNLAAVLVVGVGVVLSRMTERISRRHRAALAAVAMVLVGLVALTLSRSAAVALALVGAGAIVLWAVRRSAQVGRRVGWALAGVAAAVVASFVVPSVRAVNPVARLLMPGDAETVRSDSLRVQLIQIAMQRWQEQPWTGMGGARFEVILRREHPEVGRVLPLHHTFVEILTEYGLLVFLPFVALVAVCVWRAVPRRRREATVGRPASLDSAGVRYLMFVMLTGFVLAGVVTSSSLRWAPWWLMLASMIVLAWHLRAREDRAAPR